MTQKKLVPVVPVTSKYFKYTPACATDIRKTFRAYDANKPGHQHADDDAEFREKMFDFIPPLTP